MPHTTQSLRFRLVRSASLLLSLPLLAVSAFAQNPLQLPSYGIAPTYGIAPIAPTAPILIQPIAPLQLPQVPTWSTNQQIGGFNYYNESTGLNGTTQKIGTFDYTNFSNGQNCTTQYIGQIAYTNCY